MKSRVVYQQSGERNFHSFYNLLHGATQAELAELGLKSSDTAKYNYINQGGTGLSSHNQASDDKANYRTVNEAMKTANFEPALIKTIWSIVAAIMHLGNVKFESLTTSSSDDTNKPHHKSNNNNGSSGSNTPLARVHRESTHELHTVGKLLQLEPSELEKSLTSRLIASGAKDLVTTFHTVKEALYARDALAKVRTLGAFRIIQKKEQHVFFLY